jgi:hypothetical protein
MMFGQVGPDPLDAAQLGVQTGRRRRPVTRRRFAVWHPSGSRSRQETPIGSRAAYASPAHPGKIKGRLRSRPLYLRESRNYFLGAIASFAALATRNFTTVFALI